MWLAKPIRHRLGLAKHRLLHDRASRPAMRRSEVQRAQLRSRILTLPTLTRGGSGDPVEVHMLCGHAQLDMGIAATWSLLRYLPAAVCYVHSDGTLQDADLDSWRKILPDLVVIDNEAANEQVRESIEGRYPQVWEWRARNWAGYQVTDYSLFGDTPTIISMDSDALCLADPTYVRDHLDTDSMRWNEDVRTCYAGEWAHIVSALGREVPVKFNCGFLLMPRLMEADFAALEEGLTRLAKRDWFEPNHPYSSQTYLAIIAAYQGRGAPLPEQYRVYHGPTRAGSVVRHYVGVPSIRSRYFLEGIPFLLSQLERDG